MMMVMRNPTRQQMTKRKGTVKFRTTDTTRLVQGGNSDQTSNSIWKFTCRQTERKKNIWQSSML
jgi:hypothetical protein